MRKLGILFFLLLCIHDVYSQLEKDKALHFLGGNLYGLVGAGVANQISDGDRTWTFIGAVGGSLLIGLAKESIDQNQYGGWDNSDLLATVLGGATVGVTIDIFEKRKQRKRDKIFKAATESANLDLNRTFPIKTVEINSLSLLGMSDSVLYK
ncbi:hypothetical protein [Maribacter hydrothermalis]|uniref:Uncharacterized protein n=1 Tax=Maribacter hydrothermalis TaxID=1836467 RepID=A0A1B7Z8W1_9FLAO|nr:hypothetical protein [Maribacter hydrothermalis]APQ18852.1 hypothetical protein BTR34_16680 [Maribacter hydrothermalis]OBR39135.1 hypothetical protein A9200_05595 [Maribacter hydrothermalis]